MPGGTRGAGRGSKIADSPAPELLTQQFPGVIYQHTTRSRGPWKFLGDIQGITGHPAEALADGSVRWVSLVHPEDLDAYRKARRALLRRRSGTADLEYRIVSRTGEIRWVRENCRCTSLPDGSRLVNGTVLDVTSARNASRELDDRREMLDGILRASPAGIGVAVRRVFTEVNDRFCEITGYSREELLGRSTRVIYGTDEDFDYIGSAKYAEIASGGTATATVNLLRRDGSRVEVMLSIAALHPGDLARGVTFAVFDLSSIRRTERSLAENERLMSSIFDSVQDGISVLDRKMRIVRVNRTMERWYEHAAPLIGRCCFEAYHSASSVCAPCPSRRSLEEGVAAEEVVPLRGVGGRIEGWLDLFSFPLVDRETGETTGVIEYVRNISDRVAAEQELGRERDLLERIAEANPAGILLIAADGRITFVNRRAEEILGAPRARLLERNIDSPRWGFRHPDGAPLAPGEHPVDRVLRSPCTVYGFEHLVSTPSGDKLVAVNAAPLPGRDGSVEGVVATIEDVTHQMQARTALQRSEQLSRAVIDNSPIGISVRSRTGKLLFYNQAWRKIWAIPESEIRRDMETERKELRLDDRDTYLGDQADEVREIYLNGGVLHVPEVRTKKLRRGSAEWVSQHFYALMDDSGRVERVVILTEDITEWKKAETALRESEQRYRALAESGQDMIFVIDEQDRIIYVNSVSARAFGRDPASMIGRRQSEIFPPQIAEGQHIALGRVFATGEPLYSARPSIIGGRQVWLSTWLTPLRDESGRTVSVLGVSRDITELQEAMEKERHLQEQLAHAQRIESVGRLAGGVAHDFNNLLTVILGHLDLLLGDLPPGDTILKSSLMEILAAAEKARNVAGQLLTFSRRQLISPQSVDLNDLIRSFSGMLRRLIGEDVSIVTRLHDGMVVIKADPLQIEQVLMNLTVNARDAMPHGGSLHIETGVTRVEVREDDGTGGPAPGDYAVLIVADSGKGMDEATRLRAFDPFFTTKEIGKGTGLGLSTVYGIVVQHGGAIELSSEPGEGATFRILIPLQEGGVDAARPAREAEPDRSRSGTVLVVEDDTAVRQLVCRMLSKAGFNVLECMDPFEAATMASEADILDLLVTDVVMPGLNGREVHARVSAVRPGVRVLYISGHVGDTLSRHGVSEDDFHFLQKPFTAQALMRKVAEALG